jgi:hypothetical protein
VGVLVACQLATLLVLAPVAWLIAGLQGVVLVMAACAVCLASGLASLLVGLVFRGPQKVLLHLGFGMALRSGIPLLFVLLIVTHGRPLVEAGAVYYLLCFYFIGLLSETIMAVPGNLVAGSQKA